MQTLVNVDYVEPTVAKLSSRCQMIIMEDNDAVIKMCLKVRAPTLRHVSRTHRIDVDLLLEQVHAIEGLCIKYINTKLQLADIFTTPCTHGTHYAGYCKLDPCNMNLADICLSAGASASQIEVHTCPA